jgi:hypothetical protein
MEAQWSWAPEKSPCRTLIAKNISLRVSRLSCVYVFSSEPLEPRKLVLLSALKTSFEILEDLTLPSDECFLSVLEEYAPRMVKLERLKLVSTTSMSEPRFFALLSKIAQIRSIKYLHLELARGHLSISNADAVVKMLPFERYLEFSLPCLELKSKLNFPNLQSIHVALPAWAVKVLFDGSLLRRSFPENAPKQLHALSDNLPYAI